MNIDKYANKTEVTPLTVDYNGEKVNFYVTTMMHKHKTILNPMLFEALDTENKTKAQEGKAMLDYYYEQAFLLWVNADGTQKFDSIDKMINTYPAKLFELVYTKIHSHENPSPDAIEKK